MEMMDSFSVRASNIDTVVCMKTSGDVRIVRWSTDRFAQNPRKASSLWVFSPTSPLSSFRKGQERSLIQTKRPKTTCACVPCQVSRVKLPSPAGKMQRCPQKAWVSSRLGRGGYRKNRDSDPKNGGCLLCLSSSQGILLKNRQEKNKTTRDEAPCGGEHVFWQLLV